MTSSASLVTQFARSEPLVRFSAHAHNISISHMCEIARESGELVAFVDEKVAPSSCGGPGIDVAEPAVTSRADAADRISAPRPLGGSQLCRRC